MPNLLASVRALTAASVLLGLVVSSCGPELTQPEAYGNCAAADHEAERQRPASDTEVPLHAGITVMEGSTPEETALAIQVDLSGEFEDIEVRLHLPLPYDPAARIEDRSAETATLWQHDSAVADTCIVLNHEVKVEAGEIYEVGAQVIANGYGYEYDLTWHRWIFYDAGGELTATASILEAREAQLRSELRTRGLESASREEIWRQAPELAYRLDHPYASSTPEHPENYHIEERAQVEAREQARRAREARRDTVLPRRPRHIQHSLEAEAYFRERQERFSGAWTFPTWLDIRDLPDSLIGLRIDTSWTLEEQRSAEERHQQHVREWVEAEARRRGYRP